MGAFGTPCERIVLAGIQRVPPAEPVKTQIAAQVIVMSGSAPELGFVASSTKARKSNSNSNWVGEGLFHPAGME